MCTDSASACSRSALGPEPDGPMPRPLRPPRQPFPPLPLARPQRPAPSASFAARRAAFSARAWNFFAFSVDICPCPGCHPPPPRFMRPMLAADRRRRQHPTAGATALWCAYGARRGAKLVPTGCPPGASIVRSAGGLRAPPHPTALVFVPTQALGRRRRRPAPGRRAPRWTRRQQRADALLRRPRIDGAARTARRGASHDARRSSRRSRRSRRGLRPPGDTQG
eukprot:scaffold201_cov405-Prasinococcus_capsulatus_cf.AAC.17